MDAPFKRCTLCGRVWQTRDEFLLDEENCLNGYQYNRKKVIAGLPVCGLLLFTHRTVACGTTLAVAASRFRDGSCRKHEGKGHRGYRAGS
jgi:hypothetical protein